MTAKEVFEYALTELNKKEAPSLLLEDYNYFINKAVNQYINRMYNSYEKDQQKSDDLRVLKSSAALTPVLDELNIQRGQLYTNTYAVDLPDDYLHILNCVVEYKLLRTYKCYNKDSYWQQGALRLPADASSQIINNYYLRPCYKRPYYYIINNTLESSYPTTDDQTSIINSDYSLEVNSANLTTASAITFVLSSSTTKITCSEGMSVSTLQTLITSKIPALNGEGIVTIVDNNIIIKDTSISDIFVQGPGLIIFRTNSTRIAENRYGNKSKVRMQVRYGKDDSIFKLDKVFIDYLKAPQFIRLTQDQIDEVEDTSQILEFPDYVCQEIVNELIKLLLENASDPRIQTQIPVSQSIASLVQEQQQRK